MAQYIFVKFREPADSASVVSRLENICESLTPRAIRGGCESLVADWMGAPGAYYAIQNSDGVDAPQTGALVIGWINPSADEYESHPLGVETDGSYAIIKADPDSVSFFTDQFGSRTLWYYLDDQVLIVSTSQRAIVRFKGSFVPNQAAIAWFLSSGCQGPFLSWDHEIRQVKPDTEYRFNVESWRLAEFSKLGMETPRSGTGSVSQYLEQYETCVTSNIEEILKDYGDNEVLLPLSGGLDSRLILALARSAGVDGKLQLVNWGVRSSDGVFDDMTAASQVAAHYGKSLIQAELPEFVDDLDVVLDRYVAASEGRVDHFNGYTDAFAMWERFAQDGFRCILRGYIPFTEGLDTTESMARAHLGLERLDDFPNLAATPLEEFGALQTPFDISREEGESLVRWRDRLYTRWRVPMVVSAFSDIVSEYVDNRLPMMSWKLYCGYMALPDSAKGNKKHIEALWRKHDRSGVPFNAIGALRAPVDSFAGQGGYDYVQVELSRIADAGAPYSRLASWLRGQLGRKQYSAGRAPPRRLRVVRDAIGDALPLHVKAWLKARRPQVLSLDVIAYRLILADKIKVMYSEAAVGGRSKGEVR